MKIQFYFIFFVLSLISCVPEQIVSETETPTQIPSPIPTLTQTPVYVERIEFSMLSPDGTKIIQTKDWLTFDILDVNNNKILWSFTYDRAKFGEGHMYLYEAGYSPFYWSSDGKYIYVSAGQGWDGGVKYFEDVFGAREGVARFDVETGAMSDVIPERYGSGYNFSISPDEKGIVYIDQRETPIVLRWKDLLTNEEKILINFDQNIFDVGAFGWSINEDRLIYMTLEVENPFEENQEFSYDFFALDLENLQSQMIMQEFDQWLRFEFWDSENKVYYSDSQNMIWELDLIGKVITSIGIATPTP